MSDAPSSDDPGTASSVPTLDYRTPDPASHRWKTIWRGSATEANLAVTKLQQLGMQARTDFENTASLGVEAYAPGGAAVQVTEADAPIAKEILANIERQRRERLDATSPVCPYCAAPGARHVIHPIRKIGLLAAFGGLVLSVGPPVFSISSLSPICVVIVGIGMIFWPMLPCWKCTACGKRFMAREPEVPDDDDDEDSETPD